MPCRELIGRVYIAVVKDRLSFGQKRRGKGGGKRVWTLRDEVQEEKREKRHGTRMDMNKQGYKARH